MDPTSSWDPLAEFAGDSWDREDSAFPKPPLPSTSASQNPSVAPWTHPAATDAFPTPYYPEFLHHNDFTSEQAAEALTSLSHPATQPFAYNGFPACCEPCEQQCSEDDIFECYSVDAVPCYDTSCSQKCEWDGADTLCNEAHPEGVNQNLLYCFHEGCGFQTRSEPELLHHCTVAHACGGRTQWDCRNQTPSQALFSLSATSSNQHVHNQYCRDEFINPLLLHPEGCSKKPALPANNYLDHHNFHSNAAPIHHSSQPCLDYYHISNLQPCCPIIDTQAGPISKKQQHHVHGTCCSTTHKGHEHASRHTSRATPASIPPSELACTSPSSTNLDFLDNLIDSPLSPNQVYACCWISEDGNEVCSDTFTTALELQTHIEGFHLSLNDQQASNEKDMKLICRWRGCPYAQTKKKWRQIQHLKDHLRTHTKHKAHQCEYCQRLFSEKKSLDQHRRIHTGEKPFACEQCGARFSHQSTLSTHRRTHTGEKPYCCEICGHRDADHANFQRHKLIHEPARYKCEFCGTEFKKKANMLRHQKNKACRGLKERTD